MFTGLIQTTASITKKQANLLSLETKEDYFNDCKTGDSISVSGVCLTITEFSSRRASFFLSKETLARSRLDKAGIGSILNLEKAIGLNDRLGGHFLLGHIDTTGRLLEKSNTLIRVGFGEEYRKLIIPKGSIGVDGISLTVTDLMRDEFTSYIIPETLSRTNLKTLHIGDELNLEFDMFGKYIIQYLEALKTDSRLLDLMR